MATLGVFTLPPAQSEHSLREEVWEKTLNELHKMIWEKHIRIRKFEGAFDLAYNRGLDDACRVILSLLEKKEGV